MTEATERNVLIGVGLVTVGLLVAFTVWCVERGQGREREFVARCTADGYSAFDCERAFAGHELPCRHK